MKMQRMQAKGTSAKIRCNNLDCFVEGDTSVVRAFTRLFRERLRIAVTWTRNHVSILGLCEGRCRRSNEPSVIDARLEDKVKEVFHHVFIGHDICGICIS